MSSEAREGGEVGTRRDGRKARPPQTPARGRHAPLAARARLRTEQTPSAQQASPSRGVFLSGSVTLAVEAGGTKWVKEGERGKPRTPPPGPAPSPGSVTPVPPGVAPSWGRESPRLLRGQLGQAGPGTPVSGGTAGQRRSWDSNPGICF